MSNRYAGFPALFNAAALQLVQHESAQMQSGAALEDIIACGTVDRLATVLSAGSPSCRIMTRDLLTVFGTVSPTVGYNCAGSSVFRYRRRDPGGVFAAGSVDVLATCSTGFLCADSMGGQQDQSVQLSMNFWPLFDGTNEPVALTNSNAAAGATSPAYNSVYYFGPVYLGAALLTGCIGSRVSFGKTFQPWRFDGNVFATAGSIVARRPVISLTFNQLDHIATSLTTLFNAALGSAINVYYAKGVAGGARVANASGAHIKVSAATGSWAGDDLSYSDNGDGTVTVNVRPTGTLSISTTSTIP